MKFLCQKGKIWLLDRFLTCQLVGYVSDKCFHFPAVQQGKNFIYFNFNFELLNYEHVSLRIIQKPNQRCLLYREFILFLALCTIKPFINCLLFSLMFSFLLIISAQFSLYKVIHMHHIPTVINEQLIFVLDLFLKYGITFCLLEL